MLSPSDALAVENAAKVNNISPTDTSNIVGAANASTPTNIKTYNTNTGATSNLTPTTPTPPVTPTNTNQTTTQTPSTDTSTTPATKTPLETALEKASAPIVYDGITFNNQQDAANYAADSLKTESQKVSNAITSIQNGTTPLSAAEQAQVDGLKSQFDALIQSQQLSNTNASGVANIRGYQTGAAEYDPTFQAKTIGSIVSAGATKVAELQTKEASAIASLTESFKQNDIKAVQDAWSVYQAAYKERTDALQKTISDTQQAIKDAQAQQQKVQDNIDSIAQEAAKNGASPATLSKISSSSSMSEAIQAAGDSLQTSTNSDVAQYLFYKNQAQQSGVVPKSFSEWQQEQASIAASQAYSKAYATAKGSAAGAASVAGTDTVPADASANAGGILSATGLTYGAFLVLTGQMSQLSRDAATRNAALKQAQDYANKMGVDVSTLSSQYQALNKVIGFNTTRQSMATVQENEIQATIKNLQNVSPTGAVSGITLANAFQIMGGQQINDPVAQQYAFHLEQLRSEMLAYNLIAQGQINTDGSLKQPDQADKDAIDQVIKNGVSTGSLTGLQTAVQNSTDKMKPVLNTSVSAANKAVWDLFGVGDKYSSQPSATSSLISQEKQSEQTVTAGLQKIQTSDPTLYKAASGMFTSINPDTGQPYSASDILQAFPELAQ